MEYLRSVLAQDESITVNTRVTYDLPVNPLSHLIFTLRYTNATATITDYSVVAALLAQVRNLEVNFKGTSIISGSLTDLAVLFQLILRSPLAQINQIRTNTNVRVLSVIIPFGRKLFNPSECFPASRRGDLRLIIDYAVAQTGITVHSAQIEAVEILGAEPKTFFRANTISRPLTAGIGNDIDLPLGEPLAGILMFSPVIPSGTSFDATIGRVKLLVDNVEAFISEANWESLYADMYLRLPYTDMNDSHVHYYDPTLTAPTSTLGPETHVMIYDNYAFLDFDPAGDDKFLLQTEGRARVNLRIFCESAGTVRIIPVEIVSVPRA